MARAPPGAAAGGLNERALVVLIARPEWPEAARRRARAAPGPLSRR
jgi:hypothetical protein